MAVRIEERKKEKKERRNKGKKGGRKEGEKEKGGIMGRMKEAGLKERWRNGQKE